MRSCVLVVLATAVASRGPPHTPAHNVAPMPSIPAAASVATVHRTSPSASGHDDSETPSGHGASHIGPLSPDVTPPVSYSRFYVGTRASIPGVSIMSESLTPILRWGFSVEKGGGIFGRGAAPASAAQTGYRVQVWGRDTKDSAAYDSGLVQSSDATFSLPENFLFPARRYEWRVMVEFSTETWVGEEREEVKEVIGSGPSRTSGSGSREGGVGGVGGVGEAEGGRTGGEEEKAKAEKTLQVKMTPFQAPWSMNQTFFTAADEDSPWTAIPIWGPPLPAAGTYPHFVYLRSRLVPTMAERLKVVASALVYITANPPTSNVKKGVKMANQPKILAGYVCRKGRVVLRCVVLRWAMRCSVQKGACCVVLRCVALCCVRWAMRCSVLYSIIGMSTWIVWQVGVVAAAAVAVWQWQCGSGRETHT